ncbi:MAG: hypothetical protein ACRDRP_10575 [Pseudonocardiaceae bacterium]
MISFKMRLGQARRMATILGVGLVASGLSVAAAPAAAATDITICYAGVCTTRPLQPGTCLLNPFTGQLNCT